MRMYVGHETCATRAIQGDQQRTAIKRCNSRIYVKEKYVPYVKLASRMSAHLNILCTISMKLCSIDNHHHHHTTLTLNNAPINVSAE